MRHISFDPSFVNKAGNDLVPGKIHTIRQNYDYWKRFEGKEVALFTWEGKPYQKGSKQKIFCVRRIVSVEKVRFWGGCFFRFTRAPSIIGFEELAKNDGFNNKKEFQNWFDKDEYLPGIYAVIHFTDFKY